MWRKNLRGSASDGRHARGGPQRPPPLGLWYARWGKRALDLVASSAGLLALAPAIAGVALLIRFTLGSPVLFRQLRPGLGGRPFSIVKFRTMRHPKPGEVWFRSDDERLTRVGRMIRKLSLDELPSLWNVVRGDMSLVGPRPLLMDYLPKYTPEQNRRHQVRPGITGWAQVNGRQTLLFSRRLELDVWYVDNLSVRLDQRILLQTVFQLFAPTGVVPGQNVDDIDNIGLSADHNDRLASAPEDE